MTPNHSYYDDLSPGYDALHGTEQEEKARLVNGILESTPQKVLDVGCGTALPSKVIKTDAYIGIDPSIGMLKHAHPSAKNQHLLLGEAEHLPFQNTSFPVVLSFSALQNFHDISAGLREMERVSSDRVIITFPKRGSTCDEIMGKIQKIFKVERIVNGRTDKIIVAKKKK